MSDGGTIRYDSLVVATGAGTSYFGHHEWARHAPGLKSVDNAMEIRRRILIGFEAAEREADPARRAEWMTFVVVGGGPTGVELAGALGEIANDTLRREFRSIDPAQARIHLVEALDRILSVYRPDRSGEARVHQNSGKASSPRSHGRSRPASPSCWSSARGRSYRTGPLSAH